MSSLARSLIFRLYNCFVCGSATTAIFDLAGKMSSHAAFRGYLAEMQITEPREQIRWPPCRNIFRAIPSTSTRYIRRMCDAGFIEVFVLLTYALVLTIRRGRLLQQANGNSISILPGTNFAEPNFCGFPKIREIREVKVPRNISF